MERDRCDRMGIETGQVRSDFSGRYWVVQERVTGQGNHDGKWWIYNAPQKCRRMATPLTVGRYKLIRSGLPLAATLKLGRNSNG